MDHPHAIAPEFADSVRWPSVSSGSSMYLWRAVDAEGEVLDVLVQAKRDTKAARKLMRKLLKRQGMAPDEWVTDKNPAYGAAFAS
jgi:transposase-like protein